MQKEQIYFLVDGVVQGVGFRVFTRRLAESLGIVGWVRNLKDGRVEGIASGDSVKLKEFSQSIRQGPAGSNVKAIKVENLPFNFEDEEREFKIVKNGESPWQKS